MSDRTLTPLQRQKALQKRLLRANVPKPFVRTLPEREQQVTPQHAPLGQQQAVGNQ